MDDRLHIRVRRPLPDADMAALSARFGHLSADGRIVQGGPSAVESAENELPSLVRISLDYTAKGFADLRPLIDALNAY